MKNRLFALVSVGLSLCGTAMAQYSGGVNIDFNVSTGAGAGQPTILFGGALGQGGFWNPVVPPLTTGTSMPIRDLGNSLNAVNMSMTWTSGSATRLSFAFNNANTSGEAELLLDDVLDLGSSTNGTHTFQIGPFASGLYRVATYAVAPDSTAFLTAIEVRTNQGNYGTQTIGGTIPLAENFEIGVTHAHHDIPLYFNGPIIINASTTTGFGAINGLQIQRLAPTRLYVRTGTGTPGAGTSWASPLASLQTALTVARATPSVTEIWVASGTYFADAFPETAGDRNAEFLMRSNLTIYGGFAGTEVTLAERPVSGAETILSGHNLAYHTIVADGATNCGLDRVTVIDGRNDLSPFEFGQFSGGAGIFAENGANLTLRNCTIRNNTSVSGLGTILTYQSSLLMEDCSVRNNAAVVGSGLDVLQSTATVRRCSFTNNTGGGSGGVLSVNSSTLTMHDSLVANNTYDSNLMDASTATSTAFVNCTVVNNKATSARSDFYVSANHTIRNCIFWGNQNNAGVVGTLGIIPTGSFNSGQISDSIIQGWDGSLGAPFYLNSGLDPRFIAPVPAGTSPANIPVTAYQLDSRSPARDSGWNGSTSSTTDLLRNPRAFDDPFFPNTGFADGTIDRGCYEMQNASVICPGDLGSQGGIPGPDGIRDNNDFVVFIDYFFTPDPRADLGSQGGVPGADGLFDNNDFVVFIDLFFTACP